MLFSKKCAERREMERKTNLQLAMALTNLNERLAEIIDVKAISDDEVISESVVLLESIRIEITSLSAALHDLILPLSKYFEFEAKQMETINAELMTKPGKHDDLF